MLSGAETRISLLHGDLTCSTFSRFPSVTDFADCLDIPWSGEEAGASKVVDSSQPISHEDKDLRIWFLKCIHRCLNYLGDLARWFFFEFSESEYVFKDVDDDDDSKFDKLSRYPPLLVFSADISKISTEPEVV